MALKNQTAVTYVKQQTCIYVFLIYITFIIICDSKKEIQVNFSLINKIFIHLRNQQLILTFKIKNSP